MLSFFIYLKGVLLILFTFLQLVAFQRFEVVYLMCVCLIHIEIPFAHCTYTSFKNDTISIFSWAVSTVMTRQNSIPRVAAAADGSGGGGEEPIPALVPLWDMANHAEGFLASTFNQETDRLESATFKDFQKGEQIFIYYGARNNTNFLVHNG